MPTKKQLLKRADELGVEADDSMTKAEIEAAIASAQKPEPAPGADGRPFRLGVVMKCWGRPIITRFVQEFFAGLDVPGGATRCPVEVIGVAVVSPGDPNPHEPHPAWEVVEAPNRPLSPKGNAAVEALRGRVDAVLNVGSDDLVSPAYVREAVEAVLSGADLVLPQGLTFIDLSTGRAMAVDAPRIGAGRVLSAGLLDRLDWQPWPHTGEGPDSDMDRRLATLEASTGREVRRAFVPGNDLDGGRVVLDVKVHDNISSYDNVHTRRSRTGQAREIDAAGPKGLWAALGVPAEAVEALASAYGESRRPVRLVARVNIPGGLVGKRPSERIDKRDAKGRPTVFEASPEQAALLIRHGYAVRAEGGA